MPPRPSCFGACLGRRDEYHTPAPWGRSSRRSVADAGAWTPTRSGQPDGYASPLGGGSVLSSGGGSFYSAVSAYADAADDVDGAESGPSRGGLRGLLPQAPASVRRFLRFDRDEAASDVDSQASEGTVIPATPSADQVLGGVALAVAAAGEDEAVSIGGPPSPGRSAETSAGAAVTAPSASAVPSHPLNVDSDEVEAGEEVEGVEASRAQAPALIPALQVAGSAEVAAALAALESSPARPSSTVKAVALPSDAPPSLWGRVFGGAAAVAAPAGGNQKAPVAPSKPAPLLASPAASGPVVTVMTASGPAGCAAAATAEAPRKGRLVGW